MEAECNWSESYDQFLHTQLLYEQYDWQVGISNLIHSECLLLQRLGSE